MHAGASFQGVRTLLEVGCGVGAQTEVLLRRWPELSIVGVDVSEANLVAAREHLESLGPSATGRWELHHADAADLDVEVGRCDGAWLCWVLEHVPDPARVLAELARVLKPGSPVVVNEVQNASLFLSPYSPATLAYWTAFNEHQCELGGDPFVGAKLGNLLKHVGYRDIHTEVRAVLLDSRAPQERAAFLTYWTDLLLSGAPGLLSAERVTQEQVQGLERELSTVGSDPDAVFFYAFVHARARVG